ncbi:hypothetical protein EI94DRAFT_876076 [Lactarius quietus]|nr:hypothetical protein EI94DRAFT_876076 [Lactarius quietus]
MARGWTSSITTVFFIFCSHWSPKRTFTLQTLMCEISDAMPKKTFTTAFAQRHSVRSGGKQFTSYRKRTIMFWCSPHNDGIHRPKDGSGSLRRRPPPILAMPSLSLQSLPVHVFWNFCQNGVVATLGRRHMRQAILKCIHE